MAAFNFFKLLILLSVSNLNQIRAADNGGSAFVYPPTCKRLECPAYDVIHAGSDFEIRRYNSSVWISTQPIEDTSLVSAGRTAFHQLFDYIKGKNDKKQVLNMTAPVIIEVKSATSFVVSFFVAKQIQENAPTAKGLDLQRWGQTYIAVRQFGGYVADTDVGKEVAALYASVAGTAWAGAIEKRHAGDVSAGYIVAQYNRPSVSENRVNQIWLSFDWDNNAAV